MRQVEFTGKVGAKYMTFLLEEKNKTFHSAYFTLVESTDGRMLTVIDENAPMRLMQGDTRYKAVKKGNEFLERMKLEV